MTQKTRFSIIVHSNLQVTFLQDEKEVTCPLLHKGLWRKSLLNAWLFTWFFVTDSSTEKIWKSINKVS